jgi:hypothetical protein
VIIVRPQQGEAVEVALALKLTDDLTEQRLILLRDHNRNQSCLDCTDAGEWLGLSAALLYAGSLPSGCDELADMGYEIHDWI